MVEVLSSRLIIIIMVGWKRLYTINCYELLVPWKQYLFVLQYLYILMNNQDSAPHLSDEGSGFLEMVVEFDSSSTEMGCSDVLNSVIPPSA